MGHLRPEVVELQWSQLVVEMARKVFCVKRSPELWLSMRVSLSEVVELRW